MTGERDRADEVSPLGADLKAWRKAERARLIESRLSIPGDLRRRHDARIMACLETMLEPVAGRIIAAYWPFKGEPDLRRLLERIDAHGGRCALPVVVARGQPLIFRAWSPGEKLTRGIWNIPIPGEDAPCVVPDMVIAPVVGFDSAGYRLGYGGGFYDRTLAALERRPELHGVGYSSAAIRTIFPQWHDIPLGRVVTEEGPIRFGPAGQGA
ncbi:5-formyltetrahydrofolate cyclo-ligase [Marivibrio halodurans]|uniref:5-formyltetrahydrofolate cyclo-ligase n=1 Tax=Marivibrio halodurans TaxID=2039722 RepID=A0A8J7RZ65_9PROT|nr:5-formyltetrahydrofolate cyclo-ligase [Marivibrio halodurans]